MPKYINLETTLAGIENVLREKSDKKDSLAYFAFRLFAETLKKAPTADVVEVVRCKDCTHKVDFRGRVMCSRKARKTGLEWYGLTATNDEHFCSYGERKEGG